MDSKIPEQVDRLCMVLANALVADGEPRVTAEKKAASKRWRDPLAELLGAEDAPEVEAVEAVLRWSQHDPTWRKKITTMAGFVALFGSVKRAAEADRRNPVRLDLPADRPLLGVVPASDDDMQTVRQALSDEIGSDVYDIWLSQVWIGEVERDGERVLVLGAEPRVRSWVELRYLRACKGVAARHGFVDVVMTGQDQPSLEVANAA